jgi:hypothetical protein
MQTLAETLEINYTPIENLLALKPIFLTCVPS